MQFFSFPFADLFATHCAEICGYREHIAEAYTGTHGPEGELYASTVLAYTEKGARAMLAGLAAFAHIRNVSESAEICEYSGGEPCPTFSVAGAIVRESFIKGAAIAIYAGAPADLRAKVAPLDYSDFLRGFDIAENGETLRPELPEDEKAALAGKFFGEAFAREFFA